MNQPSQNLATPPKPDTAYLGERATRGDSPRAPGPAPRRSRWKMILALAAIAAVVLACAAVVVGVGVYAAIAASIPPADQLAAVRLSQSTKIFDRNGALLYEILDPQGGRRTIIPPEKVPQVLKQATLATEDPSFYSNPGVDWRGIARAVYYDWQYHRVVTGGSTITQQLVKNTLLTPEPTFQRKLREAVLALEVTRRYSKDQILAFYLNTIYYGNLSYGIQAASQSYFKKDVTNLDLAEASLLTGLPQSPSEYDPCVNPDAALDRQKMVLTSMVREGFISNAQADAASAEMDSRLHASDFAANCNPVTTLKAPHFVDYVRQELEQEYGPEVVYKGGLQVYTSLDPTMQSIAEDEVRKQVAALKGHDVSSGAVVAANPQTGEIYAMVGSVNFTDKSIDGQVNVTTSLRQPGSSIKPINYVTAFQKGWTAATPILDITTPFGGNPPYTPIDYDRKEHGIVNPRIALANSLNISAVKTLYFVGVPNMIATAEKFGITTFNDPSRYGLALTLGGGEVKLVELTGAYAVFANQGQRVPLTPFRKITDSQGKTVFDVAQNLHQQVVDPRYAYLITSILSDNNARAMEFGANSPLKTSRPSFAKTGTTDDFKDNWTLGGTPELVIGVWAGNPRNQPMKDVSGISGAAPIWHNVLERAFAEVDFLKKVPPHDFTTPSGLVKVTVCNESGLLPSDGCPNDHRHTEIFVSEQAPKQKDNLWGKVKIDKTNQLLANDKCPPEIVEEKFFMKMPQDVVLPYEKVVAWGNAHGIPQPPTKQSPCTGGTGTPETGTPATATESPTGLPSTTPLLPFTSTAAPTSVPPTSTPLPAATNTPGPAATNTPGPPSPTSQPPSPTSPPAATPTSPPATAAPNPTNPPATNSPTPTATP